MPRTGRPPKGGLRVQVRLPDDILAAIDEELDKLRGQHPGLSGITRSDFIRDCVLKVIAELNATSKRKKR